MGTRKEIFEYEYEITTKNGKKQNIQQSEISRSEALKRIISKFNNDRKLKGTIKSIRFVKRLSYPHREGGRKVR
jgi:hypothetical protein